jgi:ammonia channel protein AmtB
MTALGAAGGGDRGLGDRGLFVRVFRGRGDRFRRLRPVFSQAGFRSRAKRRACPEAVFILFQMTFAIITVAIIAGGGG